MWWKFWISTFGSLRMIPILIVMKYHIRYCNGQSTPVLNKGQTFKLLCPMQPPQHTSASALKTLHYMMGILPNSARRQQRICPLWQLCYIHYSDVIIVLMVSQITGVSMVCSTICSGADQIIHQSFASLGFVRGIHRWPVNSPRKGQ